MNNTTANKAPAALFQSPMMGDMIIKACRQWPDRVALRDGQHQLTYRELEAKLSRTVQYLKSLGLKPGDPIALLTKNCNEGVVLFYAANLLGLRYTPLHPLGAADDHAFILEDAAISTLVADAVFGDRADQLQQRVACVQRVIRLRDGEHPHDLQRNSQNFANLPLICEIEPDSDAFLGYTGGTTGQPKGVRLSQMSIATLNVIALLEWEWPVEIRVLVTTPISHAGMALLLPTHLRGGTVYLAEQFTPAGFMETVQTHQINVTFLVPTMIYTVLDSENMDDYDLSSLELVLYGASPMSVARLLEAIERIGPEFGQIYGQTEAPMMLTYLRKAEHDPADPGRLASCGSACAGVILTLLDENGAEVNGAFNVGEICVRSPLVMNGYYRRPEETAAAFEGGWLHTGDMAYQDEQGYFYIVDRSKDMIISGGFNVFPKEVEDVLSMHPGVSSVAVIGVPDQKWGEKVLAVVIPKPGHELTYAALADLVKEKKGAIYTPKVIEFVDHIPVTGLGKPDKKALREKYWQGSDRNVS